MRTPLLRTCVATLAFAVLAAACAHGGPGALPGGATFVVVRHAEKTSEPDDPPLTAAGLARAQALAGWLDGRPLAAVYATGYRRTQQTAAPAAARKGLTITTYDAKQPAAQFADALRSRHVDGTVLVVGHSNTAPDIAAALCRCVVAPMPETEYGRRMVVTVSADGSATLDVSNPP